MDSKIIDKVLSNTASADEARQVAAWFATDEGQEYFSQRYDREAYLLNNQIVAEWSECDIPTEKMKIRFLSRLRMRIRTFRFKVIAAVLIPFIMLVGAFTFVANRSGVFSSQELAEVVVPYGEQLQLILQDGTTVQLNSGSHFKYPKSFGLFNRNVELIGEAYFSVEKESGRPFIVNLNDIRVKVTGTKFNVKAYSDDNKIVVALEEGSVNVADKNNKVYPLRIGQNAMYDKRSGVCTVSSAVDMTLHTSWKNKSLNFYRTPLKDILKTIERQCNVRFTVADSSILNYKFSISTNRVDVNDILRDLEKVSKVQFISDDKINYKVFSMN